MSTKTPKTVLTIDDAFEMFRWISEQEFIACDTETAGLVPIPGEPFIRLIQFGSPVDAWVVPFRQWRGLVADVFRRFKGRIVMHNSRFDMYALAAEGIEPEWWQIEDTMIAMRLARPTESAALKKVCDKYVSRASSGGQKILNDAFRKNNWDFATVPIDFPPFTFYAALDTVLTARLFETDVVKEGRNSPVYSLEMQVRAMANRMEANGMRIDPVFCGARALELRDRADQAKEKVKDEFDLSVTSTTQLSHWFAERADARVLMTKETGGGKLSVDKETLETLSHVPGEVGIVAALALEVRQCEKVASTYLEGFIEQADDNDIMHPQIETIAARTGRMSIKQPALQTLPARNPDPMYRWVREAVIPNNEDEVLVSCDYEQIELRLDASLSGDPKMIEAFREADLPGGTDFFTTLGQNIFDDPTMDSSDRRRAGIKTLVYSGLYGAGVRKMAVTAGMPLEQMQELRDGLAMSFPGFFSFGLDSIHQMKTNGGFITTEYGRKLPVDAEYVAANSRLQGTAADVLKIAMVRLGHAGLDKYAIVPVHDEVLFSIPKSEYDEVAVAIEECMFNDDFAVPLIAKPSPGCKNWADAK